MRLMKAKKEHVFQPPSFEAKFQGRTIGYFATQEEAEAAVEAAAEEE